MSSVVVKFDNGGNDMHRVPFDKQPSFEELIKCINDRFGPFRPGSVLKYPDDEGDLCTVTSNVELEHAFQMVDSMNKKLKLRMVDPVRSHYRTAGSINASQSTEMDVVTPPNEVVRSAPPRDLRDFGAKVARKLSQGLSNLWNGNKNALQPPQPPTRHPQLQSMPPQSSAHYPQPLQSMPPQQKPGIYPNLDNSYLHTAPNMPQFMMTKPGSAPPESPRTSMEISVPNYRSQADTFAQPMPQQLNTNQMQEQQLSAELVRKRKPVVFEKKRYDIALEPNERGTVSLLIKNSGLSPWPQDVQLLCVGGDILTEQKTLPIEATQPSAPAKVRIPLLAPGEKGRRFSFWRLATGDEMFFGPRFPIDLLVRDKHTAKSPNAKRRLSDDSAERPAKRRRTKSA